MSADRQVRFALVPRVVTLNFGNYAEPDISSRDKENVFVATGVRYVGFFPIHLLLLGRRIWFVMPGCSLYMVRYTGAFVVYGSLYRGVRCIWFVIPGCSLYMVRYTGVFVVYGSLIPGCSLYRVRYAWVFVV